MLRLSVERDSNEAGDVDVTLALLGLGLDTAKRGGLKLLLDSIMYHISASEIDM